MSDEPRPQVQLPSSGFPSAVVEVGLRVGSARIPLLVPELERGRVRHLFADHEYGGLPPAVLRAPPVVLDVGANVGLFATYARLCYHPAAVVHCFEPYPPAVELLRRNAELVGGVAVHPFGLGRQDGEADLVVHPANTGQNTVRPDLAAGRPAGRVRVRLRDAGAGWDELGLGEVDVLKVDTEGCEVDVLEALGPRLGRTRVVLAEYHTQADRRRIDALLPGHLLFGAVVHTLRTGVVKYVRADLTA
jgi:FkbM family methyltransferase